MKQNKNLLTDSDWEHKIDVKKVKQLQKDYLSTFNEDKVWRVTKPYEGELNIYIMARTVDEAFDKLYERYPDEEDNHGMSIVFVEIIT